MENRPTPRREALLLLRELAWKVSVWSAIRSGRHLGTPGEVVAKLSPEKRALLAELRSEDTALDWPREFDLQRQR